MDARLARTPPSPRLPRDAPVAPLVPPVVALPQRPRVRGKFLFVGDEKLYVRGVTYGAFRPDRHGREYQDRDVIERDFVQMAANGINAVRIPHTTPPRALLDAAARHGLRVMVGLSAEQYLGFVIDRRRDVDLERELRQRVRSCAGHPALLCYALGNEIPALVARWYGRARIERYLERLLRVVKDADPDGLVTYVNYPSTEYLDLPSLDLVCYNVYLEHQVRFASYLERLQNVATDRPLILTEVGLDSLRHGPDHQARALDWQIRTAFDAGCAGAFVFSWTDEWHRAGAQVDDWAFGLTDRERRPKPALAAVRRAFAESPFPTDFVWPRISVVVCTYNGSRTLDECLDGLEHVDYPDYEVIVVNDGSTDATAEIAAQHRCRIIHTENRGLSSARNTGLAAATGSIVAYLDDDAFPDPHWLRYLALMFARTGYAGLGGPNLPPAGDGWIAECVARAPGNPTHILVSDRDAEHIPGCNMAFRKVALDAIAGFDTRFRVAGDDVDLCWRLTDAGFTLGFSPAAVVWHHRRNSLRAFWRQQRGYGRAEGMLERKWPERHDVDGHVAWAGRIYAPGLACALTWQRGRIYHGVWGAAPFQSVYAPATTKLGALVQSPLAYLVVAAFAAISLLGAVWSPLRWALAPLVVGVGVLVAQAVKQATHARFDAGLTGWNLAKRRAVTAALHLAQPLARVSSRLAYALRTTPRYAGGVRDLNALTTSTWSEEWQPPAARLATLEAALREQGGMVRRGGDFDGWDLETRWGSFGSARLVVAVEEHGGGCQLVRVRAWPQCSPRGPLLVLLFGALSVPAVADHAWVAGAALALTASLFGARTVAHLVSASGAVRRALRRVGLAPA